MARVDQAAGMYGRKDRRRSRAREWLPNHSNRIRGDERCTVAGPNGVVVHTGHRSSSVATARRTAGAAFRKSTPGSAAMTVRHLAPGVLVEASRARRRKTWLVAGLSLIEAMIALAVSAIIAGYAVPAYRQHHARAHRLNAALALRQAAQFIEGRRLFDHAQGVGHGAQHGAKHGATRDPGPSGQRSDDDRWRHLPEHLARTPADGPVVYRITVEANSVTGQPGADAKTDGTATHPANPASTMYPAYRIVAVPVETGPMARDACGSLVLDASGRRSSTGGTSADQCWPPA
jgi:type IV pilus assembly protein PilE